MCSTMTAVSLPHGHAADESNGKEPERPTQTTHGRPNFHHVPLPASWTCCSWCNNHMSGCCWLYLIDNDNMLLLWLSGWLCDVIGLSVLLIGVGRVLRVGGGLACCRARVGNESGRRGRIGRGWCLIVAHLLCVLSISYINKIK